MCLLPRTPRGTVIAAILVGLVGAVVLWEVLPARPRASLPLPPGSILEAVAPHGECVILSTKSPDLPVGPLGVFSLTTGRVERELLETGILVWHVKFAPDGGRVAVVQWPAGDPE